MHSPNFLERSDAPTPARTRSRTLIFIAWMAGAILVFSIVVPPSIAIIRASVALRHGKDAVMRTITAVEAHDFSGARDYLVLADTDISYAQKELIRTGLLHVIPWVSTQLATIETACGAAHDTIVAGRSLLEVARELTTTLAELSETRGGIATGVSENASLAALSSVDKRAILARIVAATPKLIAAGDRIVAADDRLRNATTKESGVASSIINALSPLTKNLARIRADLDSALPLLEIAPYLAGYGTEHRSLVLFLNNTELRPGGGFLGTIGTIRIADASIKSVDTRDIYSIDAHAHAPGSSTPPAPLQKYLGVSPWYLRDANWSPDFSVDARRVIDFYQRETGDVAPMQSVIGFTPTFASSLLAITGPITVSGETFTADNLADTLEYDVEQGFALRGVPFLERKERLVKLVDETLSAIVALPANRLEEVLRTVAQGFRTKQLMLYTDDPSTTTIINHEHWGGTVQHRAGDYLMVVDANLGSLKSDPVVKRTLRYTIVPDGVGYRATAAMTYHHIGTFDWKTTRYRTYTRFLTEPESEFVSSSGSMRDDKLHNPQGLLGTVDNGIADDLSGTTPSTLRTLGAFTSIEPGETHTLAMMYRLQGTAVTGIATGSCYHLTIAKELGAASHALTLDLDFGKNIVRADPPEVSSERGDTHYRLITDLSEDRSFTVCF